MNPKLKTAIIGCGVVAAKHMKAILHNSDRIELAAISDINDSAMNTLLKKSYRNNSLRLSIRQYTDYREMLDNEKPDITIITTPAGTHFRIAADALSRGSNILLEKPMTLTVSECEQLNNIAAKGNLRIALGHIYRYFPLVQIIARDLRHGVFGTPLYGSVNVFWGHGQDYYDKAPWRGTWSQDGGVIMNQTIHAIDLMSYFLGGKTTEVSGMTARQTHDMEAEDLGMSIIRKDNGTYITVTGTTSSDPSYPEASFDVLCTEGRIKAGIVSGKPYFRITSRNGFRNKTRKMNFYYIKRYIGEIVHECGFKWLFRIGNPHSFILKDLASSIIEGSFPVADGASGEESVRTVIAIYNSAKFGHTVKLPMSKEISEEIFSMEIHKSLL